jgi:predicted nucleic acid-binding protein
MILIDTSVLIDYLRSKDAALWLKIQSFDAAVCGIVRAEILTGALARSSSFGRDARRTSAGGHR